MIAYKKINVIQLKCDGATQKTTPAERILALQPDRKHWTNLCQKDLRYDEFFQKLKQSNQQLIVAKREVGTLRKNQIVVADCWIIWKQNECAHELNQ